MSENDINQDPAEGLHIPSQGPQRTPEDSSTPPPSSPSQYVPAPSGPPAFAPQRAPQGYFPPPPPQQPSAAPQGYGYPQQSPPQAPQQRYDSPPPAQYAPPADERGGIRGTTGAGARYASQVDEARQRFLSQGGPSEVVDVAPPVLSVGGRSNLPALYEDNPDEDNFMGSSVGLEEKPQYGWRKVAASMGFNVSRSRSELDFEKMVSGIRVGLRHPRIIGVMAGRGGVGKTTETLLLGDTISKYRTNSNIVALSIDHNGSLARRTIDVAEASGKTKHASSVARFADDDGLRTESDVNFHLLSTKNGLSILGSSADTGSPAVTPGQYVRAVERLQVGRQIILVDFGNTPDSPVYETALKSLDALVVVSATEQDSVQSTILLLRNLFGQQYDLGAKLRQRTLVLLNQRSADRPRIDKDKVYSRIKAELGDDPNRPAHKNILNVAWDKHLAASSKINPELVSKDTTLTHVEAASVIVSMLPST